MPLICATLLFSAFSLVLCQNENENSIDEYALTKVGVEKDQIFDYSSLVFAVKMRNYVAGLPLGCKDYVGTPILFSGENYFSFAQTKTFAEMYSYDLSEVEEEPEVAHNGYHTYNKKVENLTVSIPASVGELDGFLCFCVRRRLN